MKPIFESIRPNVNASFKVETYGAKSYCESAGWHIHPEYEIVYIKNGKGIVRVGNKTHEYINGVLVFLAGNIPHSNFGNKENENNLEVVLQFTKELVQDKLAVFPEMKPIRKLMDLSKHVLVFDDAVKKHLSLHFETFQELDAQGKLINFLSILDHISKKTDYYKLLKAGMGHDFQKKEAHRLEEIFEYINNNHDKKIEVRDIASKIGLTPNSFSRFFKKMTNRTFIDFVNEFRINKAIEKMDEGSDTIAGAMYHSGFNSPSYFAKQFIKFKSVTPTAYLKRIRSF